MMTVRFDSSQRAKTKSESPLRDAALKNSVFRMLVVSISQWIIELVEHDQCDLWRRGVSGIGSPQGSEAFKGKKRLREIMGFSKK